LKVGVACFQRIKATLEREFSARLHEIGRTSVRRILAPQTRKGLLWVPKTSTLDRVTVGVTIESTTLTPEQIGQQVGIPWDEAQRVGDPRGHIDKKWDRDVWQILEQKQGTLDTDAHGLVPVCVAAIRAVADAGLSLDVDVVLYSLDEN
jgi:hypothetical protein